MVSVKKNIVANFTGSLWSALMGLAFVPFYIRLMGVESYGIVGVLVSLQGMLAILDLGLSQTMSREMAMLAVDRANSRKMADTARTLEILYWAIALGVAALIVLLSGFLAYHWLNPRHLSRNSLMQALWIMALVIGLRWPVAIYTGGLNGLQRQVVVNKLLAVFSTLQGAGALAVLHYVAPTIQAFFVWQAIVALLQVAALRAALWRCLDSGSGRFSKAVLHGIWRFAAGMTGTSLVATILTQTDKILLSKMLPLAAFGYYTFATTVAGVVFRIIGPVFTAYYPRLTELVSKNELRELTDAYHQGSQLMAVTVLPVTFLLAFFSKTILELWTHNPDIVAHSFLLVSLLVAGNALNGLMHVPYALQLAYGWTKLAFYQNVVAVLVLVPAIYAATLRWGAVGAAGVWIVLNTGYLLISVQVMHRRLLKAEKWRWYLNDVGAPLLPSLIVTAAACEMAPGYPGFIAGIAMLAFTFAAASILSAASTASLRSFLFRSWMPK